MENNNLVKKENGELQLNMTSKKGIIETIPNILKNISESFITDTKKTMCDDIKNVIIPLQSTVIEEKDRIIFELWKLLDDIDTMSDIAKDNDKMYRDKVQQIQRLRFNYLTEDQINDLYEKFYDKSEEREYEIWLEGYRCLQTNPRLIAKHKGTSFKDACDNYAKKDKAFSLEYNSETLTYHGWKLYDNELKATK